MPSFVYFILLVGVLVFVHELGHFIWAKFFGVRVLKFSLGFGPRLIGFHRGETEYVIAAIPLGGYVRMLGENPLDEIGVKDEHRAFQNQSFIKRFVIVVAGPAMNLIFPIVLYFVVFLGDTNVTPASIGIVFPDRPADGKLQPGDRVVSIDGEKIAAFYEMVKIVEKNAGKKLEFEVERDGKRIEETIVPFSSTRERPLDLVEKIGRIGIMPHHPCAVIGITSPSSPAVAARLKTFDVIVSVDGKPIHRWVDFVKTIEGNRGSMIPITFLRPVTIHNALGGLAEIDIFEPRVTTLTPDPGSNNKLTKTGIELADLYVSHVTAGSPEHRAGLLPGDRLLELDGRKIRLWETFLEDLKAGRGMTHTLKWRRGDKEITNKFSLAHSSGVTEYGQMYDRYVTGIRNWVPKRLDPPVENPHPIVYAVSEAIRASREMVELTMVSIVRLVQGRISVKSIGGPLMLFEVAGTAAREGALNYLTLMAFISINLGLINLLPIPLLDGGHLIIFLIEAIARRPLSIRIREYAYIAGLTLLLTIMVLAFKNDIERQWPQLMDQSAEE